MGDLQAWTLGILKNSAYWVLQLVVTAGVVVFAAMAARDTNRFGLWVPLAAACAIAVLVTPSIFGRGRKQAIRAAQAATREAVTTAQVLQEKVATLDAALDDMRKVAEDETARHAFRTKTLLLPLVAEVLRYWRARATNPDAAEAELLLKVASAAVTLTGGVGVRCAIYYAKVTRKGAPCTAMTRKYWTGRDDAPAQEIKSRLEHQKVILNNINSKDYFTIHDVRMQPNVGMLWEKKAYRSVLSVAIRDDIGSRYGMISVDSPDPGAFTSLHESQMRILAALLATARALPMDPHVEGV